MATEEKKLYGFGVNDTSLFGETFETVDELIEFAQTEYDNENSDYFDDEDQHCILVSAVKRVAPSDFAPSLDDIADQMTDRFYSEHNIDDDAEASYHPKEEAKKEWKAFVEKYFDIPYTLIGYADVGEIAGKVAKMIRKGQVRFEADGNMRMYSQGDDNEAWEREYDLRAEAGDVLWQLSGLCSVMGWELDDIARQNLQKLADRQQRHVIDGSGDNR